jgi:uncharacterized protein YbjT (DUF2867 family)
MSNTVLVTGATGRIGGQVARELAAKGENVRAAVRDPERAAAMLPENVEVVRFDYGRPETFGAAFDGARHVLLIAPGGEPALAELLAPAVDAAAAAGVEHLVDISAMGVEFMEEFPLRVLERYIENSGVPYTIVRPNWYMQNFVSFLLPAIKQQGSIYLTAGNEKTSFIDTRDAAAVASVILTEPGHMGKAYNVTGPRALSYAEAAETLSKVSGRPIQYVDMPEDTMREALTAQGWPPGTIEFSLSMFRQVRNGHCAEVTSVLPDLLGRGAIDLEEFAREHVNAWK